MIFWFWCWPPFGSHFGGLLGAQMEAKAINKPAQQNIKKWCPTWAQTGPKGGPKMEPKSSKMRSWKHLASRVAPKWPPDPLQDRFWRSFGTIFELNLVLKMFACVLEQHVANTDLQNHVDSNKTCQTQHQRPHSNQTKSSAYTCPPNNGALARREARGSGRSP